MHLIYICVCRSGIDNLYAISYLWVFSIGVATTIIVGLVTSFITGRLISTLQTVWLPSTYLHRYIYYSLLTFNMSLHTRSHKTRRCGQEIFDTDI